VRTFWLNNDDVVGDELPDGASGVGIGNNAGMERINEDPASADAGDCRSEFLFEENKASLVSQVCADLNAEYDAMRCDAMGSPIGRRAQR